MDQECNYRIQGRVATGDAAFSKPNQKSLKSQEVVSFWKVPLCISKSKSPKYNDVWGRGRVHMKLPFHCRVSSGPLVSQGSAQMGKIYHFRNWFPPINWPHVQKETYIRIFISIQMGVIL